MGFTNELLNDNYAIVLFLDCIYDMSSKNSCTKTFQEAVNEAIAQELAGKDVLQIPMGTVK